MATVQRSTKETKKPVAKKTVSKKKTTAKPPAKKSVVRKSAVKKGAKKASTTTGKVLVCASDDECFWTSDGAVLRDLTELRDELKKMSEAVFAHHVTKDKNDFAQWVESVLQDTSCAADLRKSKKPNSARTVVVKHLRAYKI